MNNKKMSSAETEKQLNQDELLKLEAKYCSWGDTVHYVEKPNIFERCRGSYLYDNADVSPM